MRVLICIISFLLFCQCHNRTPQVSAPPTYSKLSAQERKDKVLTMVELTHKEFPHVDLIYPGEILANPTAYLLVDVRSPREQKVSRLPGAISYSQFQTNRSHYKNKKIVFYCTIGYRSSQVAQREKNGHNLAGSLLLWAHAGGLFESPTGTPTKKAHVYGKDWDLLPLDYQAIY